MRLDVASWNVHGWVAADGVRDPGRAFDVLRELDADVVALQEVEGSDWESHARSAGYTPIFGRPGTQAFGNALLVRAPVAHIHRLDLSEPGRERRGALDVVIELADGPLRVVTTHLGLRVLERRHQAARLAQHLQAKGEKLPIALLGDLNDWTPWGSQLAPLARVVGPMTRIATFPSRRPVFPLDRAAFRLPGAIAARATALRTGSARRASDHLPLHVELAPAGAAVAPG